jgi:hypothetical protein
MKTFQASEAQVRQFQRDGYLMVPGLFDAEEMDLLLKIGKADQALAKETRARIDSKGGESKLALRNDLTETIYSAIVRCHRVADNMEAMLGDEVYHFHHKMMVKEPRVGGAWEWHQDYGYWYKYNYCPYPDMGSCYVAVDRAHKGNGCLQVLRGSHHLGRIDHGITGDQTGADPERVEAAMKKHELVYCEMEPGTALFFHANLLHRSDQNKSDDPRWSLICCFNTKHNDPIRPAPPGGHPNYNPLERWDDSRVKEIGRRQWEEMQAAV